MVGDNEGACGIAVTQWAAIVTTITSLTLLDSSVYIL